MGIPVVLLLLPWQYDNGSDGVGQVSIGVQDVPPGARYLQLTFNDTSREDLFFW